MGSPFLGLRCLRSLDCCLITKYNIGDQLSNVCIWTCLIILYKGHLMPPKHNKLTIRIGNHKTLFVDPKSVIFRFVFDQKILPLIPLNYKQTKKLIHKSPLKICLNATYVTMKTAEKIKNLIINNKMVNFKNVS